MPILSATRLASSSWAAGSAADLPITAKLFSGNTLWTKAATKEESTPPEKAIMFFPTPPLSSTLRRSLSVSLLTISYQCHNNSIKKTRHY
mmetsp:Transcript_17273/g.35199  ORF Transcript_17273/g.35199 Transcript_17273/m.35199 type:complete len:90 (+) Transcript_17273:1297-1566(+)